ncbi:MAG: hypothetical protein KBD50_01690 [Candidatus Pacebacteria bacterium]|nr:hypothetical protein [Candidatus Paceibacterota bacterium]
MFNLFVRFFGHGLVQLVLGVTLVVVGVNVAFAAEDENPTTIEEAMERLAKERLAASADALRDLSFCKKFLGPEGNCSHEQEAFLEAIEQQQ